MRYKTKTNLKTAEDEKAEAAAAAVARKHEETKDEARKKMVKLKKEVAEEAMKALREGAVHY